MVKPLQTICKLRDIRTRCASTLLVLGLCSHIIAQPVASTEMVERHAATNAGMTSDSEAGRIATQRDAGGAGQLLVIGFMGGNVSGGNLVHREALVARDLQQLYPLDIHATVFANSDWKSALQTVLHHLDANGAGLPSEQEKQAARIVIYGHSWGASEAVTLAGRLEKLGIPVLLTIQIDSVEKLNENDGSIPPNVREAVNFYQSEGLLHGRISITAMDPKQTTILGNYKMSYREHPIACDGFPWFARAFMKPHIEIENDPAVWERIVALIRTQMP